LKYKNKGKFKIKVFVFKIKRVSFTKSHVEVNKKF